MKDHLLSVLIFEMVLSVDIFHPLKLLFALTCPTCEQPTEIDRASIAAVTSDAPEKAFIEPPLWPKTNFVT